MKDRVKNIVHRMLKNIQRTYPKQPTSGVTTTITIYSSLEWTQWLNNLSHDQRTQFIADAFRSES